MKTLHDGTEVEDDVPTRATPLGRFRLTPAEVRAREAEEAEAAAKQAEPPPRDRIGRLTDALVSKGILSREDALAIDGGNA